MNLPENFFQDKGSNFCALYMQVERIVRILDRDPQRADWKTFYLLSGVLEDKTHNRQTCAYFLYRQAAMGLKYIVSHSGDFELANSACSVLRSFTLRNMDDACFAASQALGTLPLNLFGPELPEVQEKIGVSLSWKEVLDKTRVSPGDFFWAGRSFVQKDRNSDRVLVLKFARENDSVSDLVREALWMRYIRQYCPDIPVYFEVPKYISFGDNWIISLKTDTLPLACPFNPHFQKAALAYLAHSDYFVYFNHPGTARDLSREKVLEIISRNSYLLGRLSSLGILHTAPIPLFHNRIQENRRDDSGAYIWTRGGRLDRWYYSSLFPNFGISGLRDFEHFRSHSGNSQGLFREIGKQFLSLFLVCGSYFRSLKPDKMGWNPENNPVDARDLFDPDFFREMIEKVFNNYYQGFVCSGNFSGIFPKKIASLVERMIEEMGVDRHMTEVLRIEDQLAMEDSDFFSFLINRGVDRESARKCKKGEQEISLYTGPHLGGFNQRFSLPELTDFIAAASAACILGKFMQFENL